MKPGIPPLVRRSTPGDDGACGWPPRRRTCPASTSLSPGALGQPARWCCAGLRRSPSMRSTRSPYAPIRCASLQMVVLLPSAGPAEKTTMTAGWPGLSARLMFVWRTRYGSASPGSSFCAPMGSRMVRDHAEDRDLEPLLDVGDVAQARVEVLERERDADPEHAARRRSALAMFRIQLGRLGAAGGLGRVQDLDRALRHLEVDLALAKRQLERRVQPRLVVQLLGGLLEGAHPVARRQDLVDLGLRELALQLLDPRLGLLVGDLEAALVARAAATRAAPSSWRGSRSPRRGPDAPRPGGP